MQWQTWMAIFLLLVGIVCIGGFFSYDMQEDAKTQYVFAATGLPSLLALSIILFISYQIIVANTDYKIEQAGKVAESKINAFRTIVSSAD